MDTTDATPPSAEEIVRAVQMLQEKLEQLENARPTQGFAREPGVVPQGLALKNPFSGDSDEDPATWLFACEQHFDLYAINGPLRVAIAATQLRGSALLWWRLHRQTAAQSARDPISTWPEFCSGLQRQFSPIDPTTTARNNLYKLTQRGSVAAYADEFRKLVLRIPDLSGAERVNRFTNGLRQHIRAQVALQEPKELEEAIRLADICDRVMSAPTSSRAPRPERRIEPISHSDPDAMQVDAVALQPLTPQQREQLRRTGGCFRCRKIGHVARDCPRLAELRDTSSGKERAQ
jgi:hypothetical protein